MASGFIVTLAPVIFTPVEFLHNGLEILISWGTQIQVSRLMYLHVFFNADNIFSFNWIQQSLRSFQLQDNGMSPGHVRDIKWWVLFINYYSYYLYVYSMLSVGMHISVIKYQELNADDSPEFGSGSKLFSVAEAIGETTAGFYVSVQWLFWYSPQWEKVAFSQSFVGCDAPMHGLLHVRVTYVVNTGHHSEQANYQTFIQILFYDILKHRGCYPQYWVVFYYFFYYCFPFLISKSNLVPKRRLLHQVILCRFSLI